MGNNATIQPSKMDRDKQKRKEAATANGMLKNVADSMLKTVSAAAIPMMKYNEAILKLANTKNTYDKNPSMSATQTPNVVMHKTLKKEPVKTTINSAKTTRTVKNTDASAGEKRAEDNMNNSTKKSNATKSTHYTVGATKKE